MTTRKRLLGYAAAAALATVAGVGLAPTASASSTWQLCNRKILNGSDGSYTTFCVTWIASTDAQGRHVERPYRFDVQNDCLCTVYITREDIGKQDGAGNHVLYTDGANHTAPGNGGILYGPSSTGYWVIDRSDGSNPLGDGQAFVNVWLAVAGQSYQAITVYNTP